MRTRTLLEYFCSEAALGVGETMVDAVVQYNTVQYSAVGVKPQPSDAAFSLRGEYQ